MGYTNPPNHHHSKYYFPILSQPSSLGRIPAQWTILFQSNATAPPQAPKSPNIPNHLTNTHGTPMAYMVGKLYNPPEHYQCYKFYTTNTPSDIIANMVELLPGQHAQNLLRRSSHLCSTQNSPFIAESITRSPVCDILIRPAIYLTSTFKTFPNSSTSAPHAYITNATSDYTTSKGANNFTPTRTRSDTSEGDFTSHHAYNPTGTCNTSEDIKCTSTTTPSTPAA